MFERVDCVVTPTTPIPAPQIGVRTVSIEGDEEDTRLATTRLVRGINVLGLPAISIPCGKTKAGLPIGLQIIGRAWEERRLLEWAAAWEENLT
jgi:aspartyl-tRNA(Asn)/glutamyl-tRNA(Gln) amidotransferase subunit A